MSHRRRLLVSVLAVALVCSTARADVLVVDFANGPGADFTDLSLAVQAAQDGDLLLVRPGIYSVWDTIDARSLTIVGDGPFVQVDGQLTVQNLAANQSFVLRNVTFQYPGELSVLNSVGPAIVQDSTINADIYGGSGPYGAIRALNARVVVTDSVILGSFQYGVAAAPPTAGIHATGSTVVVSNSLVLGGDGTDTLAPDMPGAPGMELQDAQVLVSGSSVRGGSGASQAGGAGVVASGASSIVARDVLNQGGDGVPAGDATVLDGSSSWLDVAGDAAVLNSDSPLREGETWTIEVLGTPGDDTWLAAGVVPAWAPLASGAGVLGVGAPLWLVPLGTLPASGNAVFGLTVPAIGLDAFDVFLQELHVSAGTGEKVLGPISVTTLLDAAY